VIPAGWFRRNAGNRHLKALVDGVTAAATGAIAGAAFVLGRRALVGWPEWTVALVTLGLLTRFRKVPEPLWILAAGLAGLWM
jgi:chromate transporter